jgi:hypothetical protein
MFFRNWIVEDDLDVSLARDYPELANEVQRVLFELDDKQQLIVMALVVHTCPGCLADRKDRCYCQRDD